MLIFSVRLAYILSTVLQKKPSRVDSEGKIHLFRRFHLNKKKTSLKVAAVASAMGLVFGLVTATSSAAATDKTWACKPTKSKPVTVRLIEYFAGPARTPLLNAYARQFEAKTPGVKVEIISPSQADSPAKITQLLQAKNIDIVEPAGAILGQAMSAKQIANIYPYFSKTKGWAGLTDYSKFQAELFGKKTAYMIPNGYYVKAAFVRPEPIQAKAPAILTKIKAGTATWNDILTAKSTNTATSSMYAMRGARASFTQAIFVIRAYNAPDLNSGGYYNASTKTSMFNSAKSQEALDLMMKIWREASPAASVSWGYPEMVQGFVDGVAHYLIQDNEVIQIVDEKFAPYTSGKWIMAQMPKGPTGYSAQDVSGGGWSVAQSSKCKNIASDFLDFITTDPQHSSFARAYGVGPVTKTAEKDPFFKTGAWAIYNKIGQDKKEIKLDGSDVAQTCYGEFFTQADKDMQAMYANTLSTKDALKSWAEFWDTKCVNPYKK
ncbi:MAG: extracellular solute-binding protein [Actinobacteria bacterium]|nr:extracellular solute-binding protein [Actinomycetota bacterium]